MGAPWWIAPGCERHRDLRRVRPAKIGELALETVCLGQAARRGVRGWPGESAYSRAGEVRAICEGHGATLFFPGCDFAECRSGGLPNFGRVVIARAPSRRRNQGSHAARAGTV